LIFGGFFKNLAKGELRRKAKDTGQVEELNKVDPLRSGFDPV